MNKIDESVRNRLVRALHKSTDIEKAVSSAAERLYCEPDLFGYSCKNCPLGGNIGGGEHCEGVAAIQLYQYLLQGVSPLEGFCTEYEEPLNTDEYEIIHKKFVQTLYGGIKIIVDDLFICTCKKCGEIVDVPFYAKLNQINFDLGYVRAMRDSAALSEN